MLLVSIVSSDPPKTALAKSTAAIPEGDESRKALNDFNGKLDVVRKQIVATTEGGAITGEERLREHADQLYGAILAWEGKPGDYQIARIDALRKELGDVTRDFENLLTKDLPALNDALKAKGKEPIPAPPAKIAVNEQTFGGASPARAAFERD
jgi:hypothetical protein